MGVFAAIGLWAIYTRLNLGMKVTNLTNVSWGLWVVFYIYFIGLSAGSFLLSTMVYVFNMHHLEKMGRIALVSALIALFAGLGFVWLDLGHPWRFWKLFSSWHHTSVLAWECLAYLFYIVIIVSELYYLMRNDLAIVKANSTGIKKMFVSLVSFGWKIPETEEGKLYADNKGKKRIKFLGIIGIPTALVVHGGTGSIFGVVAAKAWWFSGLFPIIFLVSALVSGCGLMLFLYSVWGKRDSDYQNLLNGLKSYLVMFIGIDIILFLADVLVGFYGNIPDHIGVFHEVMFGKYALLFWGGQIFAAWILPIILTSTSNKPSVLAAAGFFVFIGIICVRYLLVIPAYIEPHLPGLDNSFVAESRLAYSYSPSSIEWLSSIGLFCLMALVLGWVWKMLPMYSLTEEKQENKVNIGVTATQTA